MNSTPLVIQNTQSVTHSGMVGGKMYHGTSTTSAPPTVIPANTPQAQFLDQGAVEITVDLKKANKVMVVEGKKITIESADDTQVVYSISD
jgi:hypothetical protein